MNLKELGFDAFFREDLASSGAGGLEPGRVVFESRNRYTVETEGGPREAAVSGRFEYTAAARSEYPAVGDWVALRPVEEKETIRVIERVLRRRTCLSRRSPGRGADEQVIAANIDILCVVCGLDGGRNFNPRGIERYLVMAAASGARPVLALNKADLCENPEDALLTARSVAGDAPVYLLSAKTRRGIGELSGILLPGVTAAFTGPSGVGKSALINALLGAEAVRTGATRADDMRGRHTTTHRELFPLPGGGLVIDTPGLRELQAWGDGNTADDAFADIAAAAVSCRFRDCTHRDEPGCAVLALLREGRLEQERYQNYITVRKELEYLSSLQDERGRRERKASEKELSRLIKRYNRDRE
ncbi:MAG: ribosome small subunit-dependent GTPase A [Spirochaetes bacterium]|nr:ribosome small subunit-dependent GTPase A [Spirochaetota bacterium]